MSSHAITWHLYSPDSVWSPSLGALARSHGFPTCRMPFSGLFADLKKQAVFEASGVARVRGKMFVVFDR